MEQKSKSEGYGIIFKTTFLFGFVQVFNILVKVVINKIVALFLGSGGMGVIGLYNSSVNMLKTGAGLGISQSAVRDISEAYASNNRNRFSFIISLTKNVVALTAILGLFLTIAISPYLSTWSFDDNAHIVAYLWLSIVVAINIISEGQLAILKGMRQLKALAKASLYGSIVGLISAVPFYYFFREGGIIPSMFMTAFAALFFSNLFVSRIDYVKIRITIKDTLKESSSMVKMGVSLMVVSFVASLFDLIISSFINHNGGLSDVGLYHAGATIITSYFGVIITSMSTDYYPRISAVHDDNIKLQGEMNRQSETGLVLAFPLVVLFVFLSSFFIKLLYSDAFIRTNDYTDYAMIGTVIIIVSNCMGMVLLAKQASRIFLISVIGQRVVSIVVFVGLYKLLGLKGLGFAYIFHGALHLVTMMLILHHFYAIHLSKRVFVLLFGILLLTVLTIAFRSIDSFVLKYSLGFLSLSIASFTSVYYMKHVMDIDLLLYFKNRFIKNNHD